MWHKAIAIEFNGIEYRSINRLLENLGIGNNGAIFRKIKGKEKSIEEIISVAANKKIKRQNKCQS